MQNSNFHAHGQSARRNLNSGTFLQYVYLRGKLVTMTSRKTEISGKKSAGRRSLAESHNISEEKNTSMDTSATNTGGIRCLIGAMDRASMDVSMVSSTTVGSIPRLIGAMDRFATEYSSFESTTVGENVQRELAAATDINHAALIPLRHKIFGFDVALKWGFFLMNIVPRILSEDGRTFAAPLFDIARYNAELVTIYDLAVETLVWDYCDQEDENPDE